MSLTQGLISPRTPLRRFLDQELSAGTRRLRAAYRERLSFDRVIVPGAGVGGEAGTVGTAIDQRLRLAFTTADSVDAATAWGVALCGPANTPDRRTRDPQAALADVGRDLVTAIAASAADLRLDVRSTPMVRTGEEEERLARMLLVGAWYALNYRVPVAFSDTPLYQTAAADPGRLTLDKALAIPHPDLVADLLAQLETAASSPLAALRRKSRARLCCAGPTFDGSADIAADADLVVTSTLIEFKSTRRIHEFSQRTMHQLLGYVLMDYTDQHIIDQVAVYLTPAGAFISWPIEDYLALLGARRRDLGELRAAFERLLGYTGCCRARSCAMDTVVVTEG